MYGTLAGTEQKKPDPKALATFSFKLADAFEQATRRIAAQEGRDRGAQQGRGQARRGRPLERPRVPRSSLTFLLVHGAWGGSWMWPRLAPLLRTGRTGSLHPSLTGIGERSHLASPSMKFSTHIADVLATLRYERLNEVALVGHSYGGMVVTGVADRAPGAHPARSSISTPSSRSRMRRFLPPRPARVRAHFRAKALRPRLFRRRARPEGPVTDIEWVEGRRDSQPMKIFTEPLKLEGRYRGPRVMCSAPGIRRPVHAVFAERARNDPAWRYHELPTHHYPHVSMPAKPPAYC